MLFIIIVIKIKLNVCISKLKFDYNTLTY